MLDEGRFLPEVGRLVSMWRLHGMEPAGEDVLCHWARTTAAWTRTSPVPRQAIAALQSFGLLITNVAGDCLPSPALLAALSENPQQPEQMPLSLGLCIFERMLDDVRFQSRLLDALRYFKIQSTAIFADWNHVPSAERRNSAWIWLQQLGLGHHSGNALHVVPNLEPYVLDAGTGRIPLSQAELELRLQAQHRRSVLAEEHVFALEKKRLCASGAPELAEGVMRISDEDVAAGFDILSFELTGQRRFVEVKSSSGPRTSFYWSSNEYRCAVEHSDAYWLAWVGWAVRLPSGPCDVTWFRNPAALLARENSPWAVADEDVRVDRIADDTMLSRQD